MGFKVPYVTGDGTVASTLGIPDAGIATGRDRIKRITLMTKLPARPLSMDDLYGLGFALLRVCRGVQPYWSR